MYLSILAFVCLVLLLLVLVVIGIVRVAVAVVVSSVIAQVVLLFKLSAVVLNYRANSG